MKPCNYFGKGRLSYLSFYLPPTLARVCLLFTNGIYGTLRIYSTPLRRVKVEKNMTRASVKVQEKKKKKKKEGKREKKKKTERNEIWYGRTFPPTWYNYLCPHQYCCFSTAATILTKPAKACSPVPRPRSTHLAKHYWVTQ